MESLDKEQKIMKILFKDFPISYNSRSISKVIGISHAGAFKILKKLENRNIVKSKRIGNTLVYSLNFDNPVTNKIIETILTIEAQNYKRWLEEFKELNNAEFIVLFGSVIRDEKNARDIDLLVVSNRKYFKNIKETIHKKNELSNRKTHLILQTLKDFKKDIKNRNKVIIDIIKSGIVLYGQDKFREIVK